MELKKKLGKRIQELRIKNNLKQAELAEKVGIATKHQSCIETGKNYPSAELVEKYAVVLNVDVSDILDIAHVKDTALLHVEIERMVNQASEEQIHIIYKFLRSLCK